MPDQPELVTIPPDLSLIGDAELNELESKATTEFDRLHQADDVTPEALEQLMTLADGVDRIRAEMSIREERARVLQEQEKARHADQKASLQARVHGAPAGGEGGDAPATGGDTPANGDAIAAAAARGVASVFTTMLGERAGGRDLSDLAQRATATLQEARRHAPASAAPAGQLAVTAAVDIPGMARNAELSSLDALGDAMYRRARGMPVTNGTPSQQLVASIRNEFDHTVDDRTSPRDMEELIRHLTRSDVQDSLVAGGGWCAPSEIRYDFFNVACEDGLLDLPTFGVSRGGIRFPVSPSLADAGLALSNITNATQPWLWTETDDIATVTGSPNKPCIRVPCPDFDERRLECYGICLTAGNLTDDAYPETTQNFLRLLMSAHAHATNARYIATMVSLSTAPVTGGAFAVGGPAFNAIVSGIALAATDYRARYVMCEDDVLEVVIPQWVVGVIQADLARRAGVDSLLSETRASIQSHLAARNVRVQFVNDWQVRGTGQFGAAAGLTSWPTSVELMMYAAGTFLLGNGLTLDLGVVRDSTLNAENDHTAAWSEECHLIAKVGHESRRYTIAFGVEGDTCCDDVTGGA